MITGKGAHHVVSPFLCKTGRHEAKDLLRLQLPEHAPTLQLGNTAWGVVAIMGGREGSKRRSSKRSPKIEGEKVAAEEEEEEERKWARCGCLHVTKKKETAH